MRMKTKAKIASILGFVVVVLYTNDKSDIKTVGKYAGYAFLISAPLLAFIWKYQAKLDKVFTKEVNAVLVVICLFLWRWLHSISYAAEDILAFVVAFIAIFLSFFLGEKHFESFTKK